MQSGVAALGVKRGDSPTPAAWSELGARATLQTFRPGVLSSLSYTYSHPFGYGC